MRTKEIREAFLSFFEEKGHLILPSFSLVPQRDSSLLLIGAGMAPLKPYFTQEKTPPKKRIATCQKCVRTADIERVGVTSRHATFFEMLGNFSFGDYFKEEAIQWAWELVTTVFKLPQERLWASVYEEDDEAFNIWREKVNLPAERIVRLGKEDNFWEIGTGPCGPCSEIYFDLGPEYGCGCPDCQPGCDCDRYLEIWNLVFTQFNRKEAGDLEPLAQKNIDTGAGLERLAIVLQGVGSLYEIDSVKPLLDYFVNLSAQKYGVDPKKDVSLCILTEHMRTITFLVADGVMPSNEGRGYVLRRILRRAVRHGHLLGLNEPFLYKAVDQVSSLLGDTYTELYERQDYIQQVIKLEEVRFQETLGQGMEILEEAIAKLHRQNEKILPGEEAFKLYDTFGFPLDLPREILEENNLSVDESAFEAALQEQRERTRSARAKQGASFSGEDNVFSVFSELKTEFCGYDKLTEETQVLAILANGKKKDRISARNGDEEIYIFLARTPFDAESGGQVGDQGLIFKEGMEFKVQDTKLTPAGQYVHKGILISGELAVGDKVTAKVNSSRRKSIRRSHTAIHLIHQSLRDLFGNHISQAGSLVAPDRLRFDFTHFAPLTEDELRTLEELINKKIWDNLPVKVLQTSLDNALDIGAIAIFEEKYLEQVRVVNIGDYSVELCGGTHVSATGEIGLLKIVSEGGIGTGLRRIEAVTGEEAYRFFIKVFEKLDNFAEKLKVSVEQVEKKLDDLLQEHRELQKQYQKLRQKQISFQVEKLLSEVKQITGEIPLLSTKVNVDDIDGLRILADRLRERFTTGVIVLGAAKDGKVFFVTTVSKDLQEKGLHAGKLIGEVAKIVGGGGGGRPDMAQAGGKKPEALRIALMEVPKIIERQLAKQVG
ncbi:MAG: alanine--tRNA ligase [Firmicutes bacterium]|nr:alanine--tRNA ligase [Bacillota bacterium]